MAYMYDIQKKSANVIYVTGNIVLILIFIAIFHENLCWNVYHVVSVVNYFFDPDVERFHHYLC